MTSHKYTGLDQGDQAVIVDRSSVGPHCAIAHLSLHYGLERHVGTGFLLKREALGKERFVVLTAGHNLYDVDSKRHADAVVIRFGPSNSGEIIKRTEDFRVPHKFRQGQEEYDFGMIVIDPSTDPIPREHALQPMVFSDDDAVFVDVFMGGYSRQPTDGEGGSFRGREWKLGVQLEVMNHSPNKDGSPVCWKVPGLNQYVALGILVTGRDSAGYKAAIRITMETLTEYIDNWLDFNDDDWVYYPWVDSPWQDVDESERRKTWGKEMSPKELALRAEQLYCPAFNTGGAIKKQVLPKAKWRNLFSYDSGIWAESYGMWVQWGHAKQML